MRGYAQIRRCRFGRVYLFILGFNEATQKNNLILKFSIPLPFPILNFQSVSEKRRFRTVLVFGCGLNSLRKCSENP